MLIDEFGQMIDGDSRNAVLSCMLLKERMFGPEHCKDAKDALSLIVRQDFHTRRAYPEISQQTIIDLTMPFSTYDAERGFSDLLCSAERWDQWPRRAQV